MTSFIDAFKFDVSLDEAIAMSQLLARRIDEEFLPDIVVAVNKGGFLPGREIARRFDVPFACIQIARQFYMEDIFGRCPLALKPFLEIYYELRLMLTEPTIIEPFQRSGEYRRLLLVDDMVHTGKTMKVAFDHIVNREHTIVRTSALCYVGRSKPNYFVKKGNYKFPWSRTSRYRTEFDRYLASMTSDTSANIELASLETLRPIS
jgi:hypoxanthine phosphoribosyltransferase